MIGASGVYSRTGGGRRRESVSKHRFGSAPGVRFGSREDPQVFRALAGVPPHAPLDCRRGWQLEFDLGVHRVTEHADPQRDRGAHAREAVDEDPEEGAVAKTHQGRDVDAVEDGPGLLGGEDRGLAGLDDVLGAPDRARGVEGEDLADDKPVEEHPERREMLFDARGREGAGGGAAPRAE